MVGKHCQQSTPGVKLSKRDTCAAASDSPVLRFKLMQSDANSDLQSRSTKHLTQNKLKLGSEGDKLRCSHMGRVEQVARGVMGTLDVLFFFFCN